MLAILLTIAALGEKPAAKAEVRTYPPRPGVFAKVPPGAAAPRPKAARPARSRPTARTAGARAGAAPRAAGASSAPLPFTAPTGMFAPEGPFPGSPRVASVKPFSPGAAPLVYAGNQVNFQAGGALVHGQIDNSESMLVPMYPGSMYPSLPDVDYYLNPAGQVAYVFTWCAYYTDNVSHAYVVVRDGTGVWSPVVDLGGASCARVASVSQNLFVVAWLDQGGTPLTSKAQGGSSLHMISMNYNPPANQIYFNTYNQGFGGVPEDPDPLYNFGNISVTRTGNFAVTYTRYQSVSPGVCVVGFNPDLTLKFPERIVASLGNEQDAFSEVESYYGSLTPGGGDNGGLCVAYSYNYDNINVTTYNDLGGNPVPQSVQQANTPQGAGQMTDLGNFALALNESGTLDWVVIWNAFDYASPLEALFCTRLTSS